jgi:PBSX family phage terminase large subunit
MRNVLADRQLDFIIGSTKKINLAHGSVRCGKTMGSLVRTMQAVDQCPDSQIWFIGHTSSTIYDNAIRLILEPRPYGEPDPLAIFRPYCTWRKGERELLYKDKTISTVGAKDSGAIGAIQGKTMSIAYCDEMTLYPESIIDMISTRLSNPHSILIGTMNPSSPSHKLKGWIDKATAGDPNYYALKFTLEDNPFVDDDYKLRLKNSLSGVFYKRNYLGEWCLAEGAIFDFFDRAIYVVDRPPRSADYWILGIDYGTNNAFAAVLIGISTGQYAQNGKMVWVEKEYYWDCKKTERQKTSSEFADDIKSWIEPYAVKCIYVDPSAANFKLDLQRRGMHPVNADNDVENGIQKMTSEMKSGRLFVCSECTNLIREIEGYVWDPKCGEKGYDKPLKKDDHAVDALRYAINSHHIPTMADPNELFKKRAYGTDYQSNRQIMNGFGIPRDYGFR